MSNRLFSKHTLLLSISGLALNIALVWLTSVLHIPLYLDSIGTVIVAALGGLLPGIAVGFLSNCVTAFLSVTPDPMTMYYGFLNVLIAVAASWLSKKGLLRKWYGRALAVVIFSAIGGALGSVVTWVLYGFSFGQGVSAPLANFLSTRLQFGEFFAQFTADMGIDIADKLITVAVVCVVLYLLPEKFMDKLPLGDVYRSRKKLPTATELHEKGFEQLCEERLFRRKSIRSKITLLIVVASTVLSVIALTISCTIYSGKLADQYADMCDDAVDMMLPKIDGDRISDYLVQGEAAEGYAETESALCDILDNAEKIQYMYVYRIEPDGCHVVFDLDTDHLMGETVGTIVAFDDSFPYVEELLAGDNIPPIITDDTYGWLLTVYKPVRNADGEVAAYAAADIDMREIRTNIYSFGISIASLLFGTLIFITAFALWYCDRKLLDPMGVLVEQARDFHFDGENAKGRVRDRLTINTGDELEEVFLAMCRTEDAISEHMVALKDKNIEISLMQRNIIYTLANMVENRDGNTGGHIKRTAYYVKLIGQKLQAGGVYADIMDDKYIKNLFESAPLHDIGKIKIPDAILNKPGKLTVEEFELMKTHSVEGANILRTSLSGIEDDAWLSMAIDMAEYHHERWDGNGYPKGLSGTNIPLCARIMAVSDVFDALVSDRCYKTAISTEAAIGILIEEKGKHFDPTVVDAFILAKDEICDIQTVAKPQLIAYSIQPNVNE